MSSRHTSYQPNTHAKSGLHITDDHLSSARIDNRTEMPPTDTSSFEKTYSKVDYSTFIEELEETTEKLMNQVFNLPSFLESNKPATETEVPPLVKHISDPPNTVKNNNINKKRVTVPRKSKSNSRTLQLSSATNKSNSKIANKPRQSAQDNQSQSSAEHYNNYSAYYSQNAHNNTTLNSLRQRMNTTVVCSDFLRRSLEHEQARKRKLELLSQSREHSLSRECTHRPKINKNSSTCQVTPIQQRCLKIHEDKLSKIHNKKVETIKQQEKQIIKTHTFHPKINKHICNPKDTLHSNNKTISFQQQGHKITFGNSKATNFTGQTSRRTTDRHRTIQQFTEFQAKWQQKKLDEIEKSKQMQTIKNHLECTFTPEIKTTRSRYYHGNLIKNKGSKVEDRQLRMLDESAQKKKKLEYTIYPLK